MKRNCILTVDDPRTKGGLATVIRNVLRTNKNNQKLDVIFINISSKNNNSNIFGSKIFSQYPKRKIIRSKILGYNLYEYSINYKFSEIIRIFPTKLLNEKLMKYEKIICISGTPVSAILAMKFFYKLTIWSPSLLLKERLLSLFIGLINFKVNKYIISSILNLPFLIIAEFMIVILASDVFMMNNTYAKIVSSWRRIFNRKKSSTLYPVTMYE